MSEETPTPTRRCARLLPDGTFCPNPANWMPTLLLYPSQLHWPSAAMVIQVDAPHCDAHRETAKVSDLATDRIYELAEQACSNARKPWPERSLTRLKFYPWTETKLGQMKDRERAQLN
jgi:hypothetical protein